MKEATDLFSYALKSCVFLKSVFYYHQYSSLFSLHYYQFNVEWFCSILLIQSTIIVSSNISILGWRTIIIRRNDLLIKETRQTNAWFRYVICHFLIYIIWSICVEYFTQSFAAFFCYFNKWIASVWNLLEINCANYQLRLIESTIQFGCVVSLSKFTIKYQNKWYLLENLFSENINFPHFAPARLLFNSISYFTICFCFNESFASYSLHKQSKVLQLLVHECLELCHCIVCRFFLFCFYHRNHCQTRKINIYVYIFLWNMLVANVHNL